MSHDNTSIAVLIGSRICHDLISPIGAITNGLELLNMAGEANGPEMSLIGESVGNASARIRFFRIAFGAAGDQMVGTAEITSILRDLYHGGRLEVEWTPTDPKPRAAVRLAFLGILCLENAMPFGGRLTATCSGGEWTLDGLADRLNIDDTIWPLLDGVKAPSSLQPAQVQFALLPLIAQEDGRKITTRMDDTTISIAF
ncbi:histidine phosphotransferase family protein [uncultured Sulfitobacter sp.]|uniref:histidine phosphotransferase family protein n=1 Tax=uncultured Sulfitobacter sp. TaxID=191468 RepID=UPI002617D028|nr:histidine phosphotransferase family protein [uncultured Sulfitobacter sp.]